MPSVETLPPLRIAKWGAGADRGTIFGRRERMTSGCETHSNSAMASIPMLSRTPTNRSSSTFDRNGRSLTKVSISPPGSISISSVRRRLCETSRAGSSTSGRREASREGRVKTENGSCTSAPTEPLLQVLIRQGLASFRSFLLVDA
jgi:hypothetical protein